MKIAVFFSDNHYASWSLSWGVGRAFRALGLEVIDVPLPPGREFPRGEYEQLKARIPTLEVLAGCDLIFTVGPEYLTVWLEHFYGKAAWQKLKTLKAAWYLETSHRDDREFYYEQYLDWHDEHFYPGIQDAEEFKGHWLPWAVDTEIFKPLPEQPRTLEVLFTGLLYDQRAAFLKQMKPYLGQTKVLVREVLQRDVHGINQRGTAELVADAYRQTQVALNLPSYNDILVMRVFEALACGAFLVTHRTREPRNMETLEDISVGWYSTPEEASQQLHFWLEQPRQKAISASAVIARKHSLTERMRSLLAILKNKPMLIQQEVEVSCRA
jgi:glycosyltransferase involved in cell wall biosynthesis